MDMDKIDFVVSGREVNIFINGRNLIDMIREIELPFATAEGYACIAGGYVGLPKSVALPPSQQLLGKPDEDFSSNGGRTCLLVCSACGESICWPLQANIIVTDTEIIWTDFSQPYRARKDQKSIWSYKGFGPFHFSKQQYLKALNSESSLN